MGKSVAVLLAKKGANIVIVSRNVAKLEAALEEIKVISIHICVGEEKLIIERLLGYLNHSDFSISLLICQ